jgi:ornithine decarboxylase
MVNMGGGFPARYLKEVPGVPSYGEAIFRALTDHFGNRCRQRSSSRAAAWSATPG